MNKQESPTLPDLLEQAARLMPERVRLKPDHEPGYHMVQVQAHKAWRTAYEVTPHGYASMEVMAYELLEAACREECEARGWAWHLHSSLFPNDPDAECRISTKDQRQTIAASLRPTPAEALLSALIQAVEGERGARLDTGAWNEDYEGDGDEPADAD